MPRAGVRPRIVAAAAATPPARFTQEQVYELSPDRSTRFRKIFLNSGIDHRYLWIDPERFTPDESVDQLHARYREGAVHLACQAAQECLAEAGLGHPRMKGQIIVEPAGQPAAEKQD